MKFATHLFTHLTPEWRQKYIDYDGMKEVLYKYLSSAPSVDTPYDREDWFLDCDDEFFRTCEDEFEKIERFFYERINYAKGREQELNHRLHETFGDKHNLEMAHIDEVNRLKRDSEPMHDGPKSIPQIMASMEEISMHMRLKTDKKAYDSFKKAFSELYLQLVLIQNFQELNFTGFRKILKKHDKLLATDRGMHWYKTKVCHSSWVRDNSITEMIANIENVYINVIEGGDRTTAMNKLRVPPLSEETSTWVTFRLGLFLGAMFVLLATAGVSVAYRPMAQEPAWVAVRLFRGFAIIFINIFLVGINHWGWQRSGVNNVLIFELNPRDHLHFPNLLELASSFMVLWAVCIIGYIFHDIVGIPQLAFPLVVCFFFYGWLFNPFKFGYYSARRWIWKKVWILLTPLNHPVLFADFWLADQLNSLVTYLLDMEYFGCFYVMEVDWSNGLTARNRSLDFASFANQTTTRWSVDFSTGEDTCNTLVYGIRPVITVIPAAMRFFQCIRRYADTNQRHPHLTNAGKYSTTFFVVFFGALKSWYARVFDRSSNDPTSPFFNLWILAYCVSTCYTYSWDIRMDWGLLENRKPESKNWMLRSELVYPWKSVYYLAIVGDLFMRLAWTLNMSLNDYWFFKNADILICITALLECFRRFMWNFFRLENEHLNNCGQFRVVRDINIKVMPRQPRDDSLPFKKRRSSTAPESIGKMVGKLGKLRGKQITITENPELMLNGAPLKSRKFSVDAAVGRLTSLPGSRRKSSTANSSFAQSAFQRWKASHPMRNSRSASSMFSGASDTSDQTRDSFSAPRFSLKSSSSVVSSPDESSPQRRGSDPELPERQVPDGQFLAPPIAIYQMSEIPEERSDSQPTLMEDRKHEDDNADDVSELLP